MQVGTQRPSSATYALAAAFDAALTEQLFPCPLSPMPRLAVALSGGADSMALTLLADRFVRTHGSSVIALTVDHRLRAESTREAQQVAEWMRARGIAHHILTPAHDANTRNLQAAARQWRYDALAEFCHAHGVMHCLVAHTASDQRETVLLQQQRGNTADGAAGMRRVRNYRGVRFLRPLLMVERPPLEDFLLGEAADWVDDPSNRNPRFARVRLRAQLAEQTHNHATIDAMLAQAAKARAQRDHQLADAAMRLVTLDPLGFATMPLPAWCALAPLLASQLLADCITTIGGGSTRPRAHETTRLVQALMQRGLRRRTLGQCEITVRNDILTIAREVARVAPSITLHGHGEIMWDGRFRVRHALPEGEALTLRALGHDGRKQLRARGHDPRITHLPLSTPSLWHLDSLLALPHIDAMPSVRVGFAPAKPLAASAFW